MRDNKVEDEQSYLKRQETMLVQQTSNQNPSSPPSASSSPTHEFSFTVSLRPHPPPNSTQEHNFNTFYTSNNHKTTTSPAALDLSPAAIDLSPADDIFFHGHLLPLHFLSHLPVSPRSSTNSMDSFTLPIRDILYDQNNPIGNTSFHCHHQNTLSDFDAPVRTVFNENKPKSKSFSIFGKPKWKKGCQDERERDEDRERNNNYKKLKLDLTQLIKRYMKMVRPLLSFPKSRRSNTKFNRQSYSFSSNMLSSRRSSRPPEMSKRRGEFSAPVSMRTSPANSGVLLASGTVSPTRSTASDSTMEELHAAIQAAIAHCKNSIAMEDNIQSQN